MIAPLPKIAFPPIRRITMSMERKLTLIIFAAIVMALAVASTALIYYAARTAREQMADDLVTLTDVIGNNSRAALMFNDPDDGEDILSALSSRPVIHAAKLYDSSGEAFARFIRDDTALDLPEQSPIHEAEDPWEEAGYLWMSRLIVQDGSVIGSIVIVADLEPMQAMINQQFFWSILITAGAALLATFIAARVLHLLLKHIRVVVDMARVVARGSVPKPLPVTAHDEIGELQEAFNQIVETTKGVVHQTKMVAQGDYSITIQPRSDEDEMAHALIEMTAKLNVFREESEKRAALKSGLSELNDQMRGEQPLSELLNHILAAITQHLDAQAAVLYLTQADGSLQQAASYATTHTENDPQKWSLGEGLVGRAAVERQLLCVSVPPEQALPLRSGLVEGKLCDLAFMPLIHDQVLAGVLEVGRLHPFNDGHRDYLQQASASIAIAIESAQSRARLAELLAETQRQSERLREQQRELQKSNQELEREMDLARKVQLGFLPSAFPHPDRIQFAHSYEICTTLGGDLFDAFPIDENRVGLYVADVAGHGVNAALISGLLKMAVENIRVKADFVTASAHLLGDPAALLGELCTAMADLIPSDTFITMNYSVIDLTSKRLLTAAAGHPYPYYLKKTDAPLSSINIENGPALGLGLPDDFTNQTLALESGDVILYYTDGITEAMNAAGDEFGDDSFAATIAAHRHAPLPELIANILSAVNQHRAGHAISDDCTLLACCLK